ncbi:hypothetical protein HHI36_013983 [Cryptolaemus montrouzieri]|uniref:Sulfotransferase domain-containing protein n=1 Tax=Cryptolaemus montrouzieri TaxID=559131 RepID=A0ABD2N1V8_9CUCU
MECTATVSKIPEIVCVEENLNNELKSYFKGQQDGFIQVGPQNWFYPMKYKKLARKYIDFEVRPDDVWITGVPRSGTTVTQELVWLLKNNLDFEGTKKDMMERVPFLEIEMIFNDKTLEERMLSHPQTSPFSISSRVLEETKKNRVIKTHLPFELLPSDIFKKRCKVIYVCRYPKDVAVSYYHIQKSAWHINFQGDFSKYWSFFQNGNCMFGPYFEHVRQGFEKKELKNVLFVFYEDLRKNLRNYIELLSKFLEKPLTEMEITKLEEHLGFENFQKNLLLGNVKGGDFVRKGKVGGWAEFFTDEMNEKADEWINRETSKIGFQYPSKD